MLTERLKADRVKLAKLTYDLAVNLGSKAEVKPERPGDLYDGRRTTVYIKAPRGLCVSVDFNGRTPQSSPDTYVLSWHMSLDSDACLADAAFNYGHVNSSHHRKATDVVYTVDDLFAVLTLRLTAAKEGTAFDAAREAASIAKNGTAAEQAARCAQWRAEEQQQRESACKS